VSGLQESFIVTGLSYETLYYFAIKVYDDVGNQSGLSAISASTKQPDVLFYYNMEPGNPTPWTADSESLWHREEKRSNSPVTSWAYNTGPPNYNYEGHNWGTLTSPLIDLSGLGSATLKFNYWYETESSAAVWDERWIQIGIDGYFTDVAQLSGDPMLVWNEYSLDLSAYVGNEVQVRLFFDSVDDILNDYEGWYIDDVVVIGEYADNLSNGPEALIAVEPNPTDRMVCQEITFDGSGSSPAGSIVSYQWDFGDNSDMVEGQTVKHTYRSSGTFSVTLTVTDIDGLRDIGGTEVNIGHAYDDDVEITKAEFSAAKKQLSVVAICSKGGCARLEVEDYGSMSYDTKRDIYKLSRNVDQKPEAVKVVWSGSDPEISAVKNVVEKAGGGGKKKK
jgi:hypothetical protein